MRQEKKRSITDIGQVILNKEYLCALLKSGKMSTRLILFFKIRYSNVIKQLFTSTMFFISGST